MIKLLKLTVKLKLFEYSSKCVRIAYNDTTYTIYLSLCTQSAVWMLFERQALSYNDANFDNKYFLRFKDDTLGKPQKKVFIWMAGTLREELFSELFWKFCCHLKIKIIVL